MREEDPDAEESAGRGRFDAEPSAGPRAPRGPATTGPVRPDLTGTLVSGAHSRGRRRGDAGGADPLGAVISSARPEGSELDRILTPLEKLDLRGAVFWQISLDGVDFSGADLQDARFEHAGLRGASFAGADLRGVHFLHCDLRGIDLRSARLGENRCDGSWLCGERGLSRRDRERLAAAGARILRVLP